MPTFIVILYLTKFIFSDQLIFNIKFNNKISHLNNLQKMCCNISVVFFVGILTVLCSYHSEKEHPSYYLYLQIYSSHLRSDWETATDVSLRLRLFHYSLHLFSLENYTHKLLSQKEPELNSELIKSHYHWMLVFIWSKCIFLLCFFSFSISEFVFEVSQLDLRARIAIFLSISFADLLILTIDFLSGIHVSLI